MSLLAKRARRIDSSGIRRVFELARSMKDPINLSIGQPDFDVPDSVKAAAIGAIEQGQNSYTPTNGIVPLREQLIVEEKTFTGRDYRLEQMLVTSGVSGGLFLSLLALVDDGDEVIIPDPYFVMYKHLVNLNGGKAVYLDTYDDGFSIDPDKLAALITPKTKILLLNSPGNPTGRVFSNEELQAIAKVCDSHGVLVITDEIYRAFAYTPMKSISEYTDNCLVLAGHSKSFGMTGWRLGYAAGPVEIIQAMATMQQYSFVCAPSVAQYAALACPQTDMTSKLSDYAVKRDLMYEALSGSFEVGSADGAFYLFVKAPEGYNGDSFVETAIENNVLIIPGSVFSERDSHFRVCYTVPNDKLLQGAEVLCSLVG
ncbi:MAG: aminotransferase class I/II-fold pyridoxal phosphate-dependent enzyme [Gammaproteobacteria bacterium]|nr:aminotransferase class I/II-fold pyridoxal phosphate-dependent enzyme [Gammaproteobacteria bacterium]